MKTFHFPVVLFATLLLSNPLLAASDDAKIEDAAKASYNYRTILEGHVSVSSTNGVVTLTGTVHDQELKTLAEDTVNNLPGVVRVDNQIKVEPAPTPAHSDGWIAFKIRYELLIHSHVSATTTTVNVKDGLVTLTGNADNQAQKDLTEFYAKGVQGVKSVTNQITVNAPAATANNYDSSSAADAYVDDTSITAQIKHELGGYPSTKTVKPTVTTTNGAVLIGGTASSNTQKTLITQLAQSIRGVRSVTNNMTVSP